MRKANRCFRRYKTNRFYVGFPGAPRVGKVQRGLIGQLYGTAGKYSWAASIHRPPCSGLGLKGTCHS